MKANLRDIARNQKWQSFNLARRKAFESLKRYSQEIED